MASTTFHPCPQSGCNRGAITTMVPAPIFGSKLKSSVHLAPSNEMCPTCKGRGRIKVEIDAEPVEAPASTITYCGHVVDAPGFDQDSFTRAMLRAFCDDLQITPYHDGRHIVHHVGSTGGYVATREHCDCTAGCAGTPCKHRAFLIACLDIREPHVRREWAKLNRGRPIRKAVAA